MDENTKADAAPVADEQVVQVISGGDIAKPGKKRLKIGLLALAALVVIGVAAGLLIHKKISERPININGILITRQQIKDYAAEVAQYKKSHPELQFDGSPTKVATDDLILNAALRDQAKQHHITVTNDDIDTAAAIKYESYGSKEKYLSGVSALGIPVMAHTRDVNAAYEAKLDDALLQHKALFVVAVMTDTPFVNAAPAPGQETLKAKKLLENNFLSLFQQKQSKEAIASHADYDIFKQTKLPNDAYFKRLVTTTFYINRYSSAKPYFNDIPKISPKDAVSTDAQIQKLTQPGQYTPVFLSQAGFYGIIRLESKSAGSYDSWDQLLKAYKSKYASNIALSEAGQQKVASMLSATSTLATTIWKQSVHAVFPKVYAAVDCSGHYISFNISSYDVNTNTRISGMKLTETRNGKAGCANANGTYIGSNGTTSQSVTTKSTGAVTLKDNCYNPAPNDWTRVDPTGYTYSTTKFGPPTIGTDGPPDYSITSPSWTDGNLNAAGTITWDVYYKPPTPVWTIAPSTTVSATTAKNGASVTFNHTIKYTAGTAANAYTDYRTYHYTISPTGVKSTATNYTGYNGNAQAIPKGGSKTFGPETYTIPAGAALNSQYCEYLGVNPYKSPTPNPSDTVGAAACVKVVAGNPPDGTFSCNSGGTSGSPSRTITGASISDADKSGAALTYTVYENNASGAVAGSGTTSGGSMVPLDVTGRVSAGVTTYAVVIKGINSSGTADNNNATKTVTCQPIGCGGAGGCGSMGGCPGDAKINANTLVQVDLPDQTPAGRTAAPSGYTTDSSATYEQDVPANKTKVTAVNDISSGGASVPPSKTFEAYQTTTLDYQSYVASYPYDINQASVSYDSYYTKTNWYVVYDHYQCDSGGTLSGSNCNYSYAASYYTTCPTNYFDDGAGRCVQYHQAVSSTGTCPSGDVIESWDSGSCYTKNGAPTKVYYCNGSDSLSGTTCSGSYGATAYYRWVNSGSAPNTTTSNTVNAYQMQTCYDRSFDTVPAANNASLNDTENPSQVNFYATINGGLLSATDHPAIGVRDGLDVILEMDGDWYVRDVNGNQVSGDNPFVFSPSQITISDGNSGALTYSGFSNGGSYSASISRPPLNYGDQICFKAMLPSAIGTMAPNGNVISASSDATSNEICSERVGNKPYFRAFGGDIFSGGSFAKNGACTTPASASTIGQYRLGVGGAGTELADIALIKVSGVASATLRSSAPTEPNGLTFANSGIPTSPPDNMGGQYSAGQGYCAPDYFTLEQFADNEKNADQTTYKKTQYAVPDPSSPDPKKKPLTTTSFDVATLPDNQQTVITPPSGTRIKLSSSNPSLNLRHTIFIDGDAEITSDITYDQGPWGTTDSIPYLTIIVKGNLYIDAGVSNLDGVYIAQPRTTANDGTGRIFTCNEWYAGGGVASNAQDVCMNKLTVTGSFVAQRVVLQRTVGTLTYATDNGGTKERGDSPNVAEVFQYSPEQYIGRPVFKARPQQYDSIKGLPPSLQQ